MPDILSKYKTYSSGKLEIINRNLPQDIKKITDYQEKLDRKLELVNSKIFQIEENIEKTVEKKVGKRHFYNQDKNHNFFLLLCFLGCSLYFKFYLNWEWPNSLFVGFFAALVLFVPVDGTFALLMNKINDFKNFDYDKNRAKINHRISKKYNKKNKKKLNSLITQKKNVEKQIDQAQKKYEELYYLDYKIYSLKNRARRREERAKIVAFDKKAREGASIIRQDLLDSISNKKNWKCPYCLKNKKIELSEADHIHPINKGGLSTYQNMVLICKECNQNKKALTLRVFCRKYNFDLNEVCERLEQQGKDV